MDKKWIWLLLFIGVAALGLYTWTSGKSTETPVAKETVAPPPSADAPMLGSDKDALRPPLPSARQEASAPTRPNQGFGATPNPSLETFSPPPDHVPPTGPGFENQPQGGPAFENPDFITPPPPPAQFDNEAIPFDDDPNAGVQPQYQPDGGQVPLTPMLPTPEDPNNPPGDGDY